MKIKKLVLPMVFCAEMIGVCYYFGISSYGLQAVGNQKDKNAALVKQIDALHRDVSALEHATYAWDHDPFYVEQVAREELHMARDDELVYFS
jgi:cell division protein FtsB